MKKQLAILSFIAMALCSCEKTTDDPEKNCQKGTIKFVNESKYKYDIVIDDKEVKKIDGKSTYEHSAYNGTYFVVITQSEGYKINARVTEHTVTLTGCDTDELVIKRIAGDSLDVK